MKKIAKTGVRPQVKKMARCREQQGEENGEDARPQVKNPSIVNIPQVKIPPIPRGSAGPTLKALHRSKQSIMQAKNNLYSKHEQLDQEMADVEKAIAVAMKMRGKESLLTVKKEENESSEVEEEDYHYDPEEEEDNVKEEEEETEMCDGVCSCWHRKKHGELQFCNRRCNLAPSHDRDDPDSHCECGDVHFIDENSKDLAVEERDGEWRGSESKRRRRKMPPPPPFPEWRRTMVPRQPPFPPPVRAGEESAVPGLGPAQAGEEFAGEKSSAGVCGREEQDEENKQDADKAYARMWFKQKGLDKGIPKEYTPCLYFFKAGHGCTIKSCQFSHNAIFHEEPFAAMLKTFTWRTRQSRKKRR